jgi:hypothetical protein
MAAAANKLIGLVLHENYRLTRLVGTGGMGAIYKAVHVRLAKMFLRGQYETPQLSNTQQMHQRLIFASPF